MAEATKKDEPKVSLSDLNDDPSLIDSLSAADTKRLINDDDLSTLAGAGVQALFAKHAELHPEKETNDGD